MNIIINGGTKGIGKEVVLYLGSDINNQIMVTGRDIKALKNLTEKHKNIYTSTLDISVLDSQAESFLKAVTSRFKKVDILINIAGLLIKKDFMSFNNDDARLTVETNFIGPATLIRLIKPLMPNGSHIVNITSMGGFQGSSKYRGLSYYSASKAALSSLSECLASEFLDSGISVNSLALGAVRTEMFEEAFPGYTAPVKAKEMAEFICGFAINGHRFINGKIIPVALNNP